MLAPSQFPEAYQRWNRQTGAPTGYVREKRQLVRRFVSEETWLKWRGPFSIQPGNNTTRRYEYPWAWHAADLSSPKTIVEIGGSLAGFQFILSAEGHRVINVDPGMEAEGLGWEVTPETLGRLNKWFGTTVELRNTTLDKAGIDDNSVDLMFSISVLEHLTHDELKKVMNHAERILRPRGQFVITMDLFINLIPFTRREKNDYGTNQDVREMEEMSQLQLVQGKREELYGYPEFDAAKIQENLENYLVGNYPTLTQCIVLQKPATD